MKLASSSRAGRPVRVALAVSALLLISQISLVGSQATGAQQNDLSASGGAQSPPATSKTSTTNASTSAAPATTTTTSQPSTVAATTQAAATAEQPPSTSAREPSEQEIQEARKLIHEIASTLKVNPNRLVVNRPVALRSQDFAPESPEAKVADATSQFGLNFIKSLPATPRQNTVISPVSMKILLNILLLGTKDESASQLELLRVLGDEQKSAQARLEEDRVKPHAAMHSLLEHISRATHMTIEDRQQQQLLNSSPQLAAHLQTSVREGEMPLSGQVNFTLANLMLTNSDLIETSASYEQELERFYDIQLERFSRHTPQTTANATLANETTAKSVPIALHDRVNSWVRNITQGQIEGLVGEADLEGSDLAIVLLNAAHFKGRWLHTFNAKLTQERIFYNEGQEMGAKEVKFMRQNGVFGYGEFGGANERSASGVSNPHTSALTDETLLTEDQATTTSTSTAAPNATTSPGAEGRPQAVAADEEEQRQNAAEARRYELTAKLNCSALMLPFSLNDGQELSMVVLLPNNRDGISSLLSNLNGQTLNEIYKSLNEQQVQVELPKFSFESSHDARATLQTMGVSSIFKDGAELDRMFAHPARATTSTNSSVLIPPVKVDKVIHKAKIAVDEMGAEAAAASAATIVLRNLIRPPNPTFVADHPFLFIIRHNRSNLPLFMGRIERL